MARILALPAVVVLVLLALLAAAQLHQQNTSRATSRSVELALSVQKLVHELQTERGITAAVLSGNPSFRSELGPARRLADQQQGAVQRLVRTGSGAPAQIRSALADLGDLAAQREATDTGKADRARNFAFFTDRIAALSGVDVGLDNGSDPQLRRGAAALLALQDLAEATAQERAFLNGVFSAGGFENGEFLQFAQMRADRQSALERFTRFATPEQRAANAFVFDTGAAQVTADFEQVALAAADGRHIVVNPQSWWSGLTTVLDDLQQLQEHVGSQIQVRAHDLQVQSQRQIAALLAGVLLCFAGSIYLTVLASRSITRPLAALAAEADSVATDRLPSAVRRLQTDDGAPPSPPLPVQVPQRATTEVRSVATALDRLQAAAYGLATDQAIQRRDTIESMANLGRRNQNLIRRQLGFITSLEREEIDPSSLANLFELDHLATRMRRNAASLLVLVGASSPRQWSTAVSVADMIRAAVSEVEEYRRVALRRVDEAFVTGAGVGSVAHLLAELVENGLTFSPPDMEVEVQGRRMGDSYLIAITDQGIGMSTEDLRQANAKLRGEGDFIATPTRFLGHFVVGRLARDTGVDVQLLPSPVTGVTARVTLPPALLSFPASVSVQSVTDTGSVPRHSVNSVNAVTTADAPVQLTSKRLALPQGQDDDADRTPPSGLPLPGRTPLRRPPGAPVPQPAANTGGQPITTGGMPTTGTAAQTGGQPVHTGGVDTGGPHTGGMRTAGTRRGLHTGGQPVHPAEQPLPTGGQPVYAAGLDTGGQPSLGRRPGATQPSTGDTGSPVTANGLRKRTPRAARTPEPAASAPARRIIDLSSTERPPAVDSSPAEVGARMTALRAGMQRGRGEVASAARSRDSGVDSAAKGSE